jgi:hypothetical protein
MSIKPIQGKPYKIWGEEKTDKPSKKEKIGHRLPELELVSSDVPEIKDWKVGEKIMITIEVSPVSINTTDKNEVISDYSPSGENDDEKKGKEEIIIARVEVTGVKVEGSQKEEKETKKEKSPFDDMKSGGLKIG